MALRARSRCLWQGLNVSLRSTSAAEERHVMGMRALRAEALWRDFLAQGIRQGNVRMVQWNRPCKSIVLKPLLHLYS